MQTNDKQKTIFKFHREKVPIWPMKACQKDISIKSWKKQLIFWNEQKKIKRLIWENQIRIRRTQKWGDSTQENIRTQERILQLRAKLERRMNNAICLKREDEKEEI